MPNHIANKLEITGNKKDVIELTEFLKGENGDVDFNNLIEMPKELLDNDGWYDWRCDNWGTKWNAYEISVELEEWDGDPNEFSVFIRFCTAWSGVPKLMAILAERFPRLNEFRYTYADEDYGYNVGRYWFKNGKIEDVYIPEGGSREAEYLADEVW